MRQTVHKMFWVWEFEKEEKWLNEMAAKGLCLVSIGFCRYDFEECTPGEYNIRLELLDNMPTAAESRKYISFVEDTGAEYLGSVMRWAYFRKKTSDGAFDLFSDNASRISHLNRIMLFLAVIGISNFLIGCSNLCIFFLHLSSANIYGVVNIILSLIILYGWFRLKSKRDRLKKEQQVFE